MPRPAFRRPLGLALSGGGTLGAWEAGVLRRLADEGVEFDRVWGFSIGAFNGAALALGRLNELGEMWNRLEEVRPIRLSPRRWFNALLSDRPLRGLLEGWSGPDRGRSALRVPLNILSLNLEDDLPYYSAFEPSGGRWEGDLLDMTAASCAIPIMFPSVKTTVDGRVRTLVDGGLPGRESVRFQGLEGCADILSLSVVARGETDRWAWHPGAFLTQRGKRLIERHMGDARRAAEAMAPAARVLEWTPSRPMLYEMLNPNPNFARRSFAQGVEDAARRLETLPAAVPGPTGAPRPA